MHILSTEQKKFLSVLLCTTCLKTARKGEFFTTKSGRKSPYFLNFGQLCNATNLEALASYYALAIQKICERREKTPVNNLIIFGPAYKGIPLAIATTLALKKLPNFLGTFFADVLYMFNRKEKKTHGDGGTFVGATPQVQDTIILVDDVLTSGKSIIESLAMLSSNRWQPEIALVTVDRMEKALYEEKSSIDSNEVRKKNSESHLLAKESIARTENIKLYAMLDIAELITIASETGIVSEDVKNNIFDYLKLND